LSHIYLDVEHSNNEYANTVNVDLAPSKYERMVTYKHVQADARYKTTIYLYGKKALVFSGKGASMSKVIGTLDRHLKTALDKKQKLSEWVRDMKILVSRDKLILADTKE